MLALTRYLAGLAAAESEDFALLCTPRYSAPAPNRSRVHIGQTGAPRLSPHYVHEVWTERRDNVRRKRLLHAVKAAATDSRARPPSQAHLSVFHQCTVDIKFPKEFSDPLTVHWPEKRRRAFRARLQYALSITSVDAQPPGSCVAAQAIPCVIYILGLPFHETLYAHPNTSSR